MSGFAPHLQGMEKYRINFKDAFGTASIECDSYEEYKEALQNISNDPMCDGIWTEYYDEEEGWQA